MIAAAATFQALYFEGVDAQHTTGVSDIPVGTSLAEVAEPMLPEPSALLVASLGGLRIPREYWRNVHPKAGATVTLRLVPEGEALFAIGQLVAGLVPGAAALGGAAANALFIGPATAGLVGASTLLAGAVIVAGSAFLTNQIISSLIDVPNPDAGPQGPNSSPSANATQNRELPFGPVWQIFGTRRVYFPRLAKPFTRIEGGERHVYELFGVEGPCRITDLRIGTTELQRFTDDLTDVEVREGWPDDPPTRVFTDDVDTLPVGVNFETPGAGDIGGITNTLPTREFFIEPLGAAMLTSYDYTVSNADTAGGRLLPSELQVDDAIFGFRPPLDILQFIDPLNADAQTLVAAGATGSMDAVTGQVLLTLAAGPTLAPTVRYAKPFDRFSPFETRRSDGADEIALEFQLPRGIIRYNKEGKRRTFRFFIQIQAKRADLGEGAWKDVDNIFAIGGSTNFNVITLAAGGQRVLEFAGRDESAFFRGVHFIPDNNLGFYRRVGTGLNWDTAHAARTLTRSSGSWVTDGFIVGQEVEVRWRGAGPIPNYARAEIATVTATVLTLDPPLEGSLVDINRPNEAVQGTSNITDYVRGVLPLGTPRPKYDIRVRRYDSIDPDLLVGGSDPSTTLADISWVNLQSVRYREQAIGTSGIATLAVRINAEKLGSANGMVNALVSSYLPLTDGATITLPTRATKASHLSDNPADALLALALKRPEALTATGIDLLAIKAWRDFCAAEAPARRVNWILDFKTPRLEALRTVAARGRAKVTFKSNLLSVTIEQARLAGDYDAVFQPWNVRGWTTHRRFDVLPHAMRCTFFDELNDYAPAEEIVFRDGYSLSGVEPGTVAATDYLDRKYVGEVSRQVVRRDARVELAIGELRPETHTFTTGLAGIGVGQGSLIRVAHPAIYVGLGQGRLTAVTTNGGGDVLTATLSGEVTFELGSVYALEMWINTGTKYSLGTGLLVNPSVGAPVTTRTVTFTVPIPAASAPAAATDGTAELYMFGLASGTASDCIVTEKRQLRDFDAEITCVDAAPGIFDAETGIIPSFNPNISIPPTLAARVAPRAFPISLVADESSAQIVGPNKVVPFISVTASVSFPGTAVLEYQARYRLALLTINGQPIADTLNPWKLTPVSSSATFPAGPVVDGSFYDVEVRAIATELGAPPIVGPWSFSLRVFVQGLLLPPPPPVDLQLDTRSVLTWNLPNAPIDLAGFEVRMNIGSDPNWATAQRLHQGLVSSPFSLGTSGSGLRTILVKSFDFGGRESTNATWIVTDITGAAANVITTTDEDPGFSGLKIGGHVVSNELVAFQRDGVFWTEDARNFWGMDADNFWDRTQYSELTYEFERSIAAVDAGAALEIQRATQGALTLSYRQSTNFWADPDTGNFWGDDSNVDFWGQGAAGFQVWPGRAFLEDSIVYTIRARLAPGPTQGKITQLSTTLDVPDIEEVLTSVSIGSGGTRLNIAKTFRTIVSVEISILGGGSAVTWTVSDYQVTIGSGPLINTLDATGAGVAGTVNAIVRGY